MEITYVNQKKITTVAVISGRSKNLLTKSFLTGCCMYPTVSSVFLSIAAVNSSTLFDNSSGVYIYKSIVNYLRHGNYLCKSEANYLVVPLQPGGKQRNKM
jgi:hypothetical protein